MKNQKNNQKIAECPIAAMPHFQKGVPKLVKNTSICQRHGRWCQMVCGSLTTLFISLTQK